MPYVKESPLAYGTTVQGLIRYLDGELEKISLESERVDAGIEALRIIGVSATWFWEDVVLGEPPPQFMRADSNIMNTMTQINVNYIDAQGRDITQVLKTSTIEPGDLLGLIDISGLGAGNFVVNGAVVFQPNHIEIPVTSFQGQSGNPAPDDVMGMRWEFNTQRAQEIL